MKLMITGSRKIDQYEPIKNALDELHQIQGVKLLLHGGAKGADELAQRWADENGVETKVIKPNYNDYPTRYAPLERNIRLVTAAEKVMAFYWKTKTGGTLHAATEAQKQKKLIKEIILNQQQKSLF